MGASTSIAPTGAMEEGLHHLHCSCRESATCDCRTTSSGASMPVEDEVELRQAILNDTQQLQALWKAHGSHDAQVSCSCAMESDDCQCEYNATSLNETAVASINETAKLLSSWWAGEGGHVDAYGRGRVVVRGGGSRNGNRYRGRVVVRRGGYGGYGHRGYVPPILPVCNAYGGCGCGYV